MMKHLIIFILAFTIISCSKDNHSAGASSFIWTHQNISHSASGADAYVTQAGIGFGPNQIVAYISSMSANYKLSIRLTSLIPGSYPVSLSSNKVDYIDDQGFNLAGTGGSVIISSNEDNK